MISRSGLSRDSEPQSDSPMSAKESFKLLMALAANSHSSIASVDICAAFLQRKGLDREVYLEPSAEIKNQGIVWKLNNYCIVLMMQAENLVGSERCVLK